MSDDTKPELPEPEVTPTKEELLQAGGTDLDNLPKQTHIWVRRGLKMSCEGAQHPHHSHFLIRR